MANIKKVSLLSFQTLIKRCWSRNPKQRPPFSEIVQILQENVSIAIIFFTICFKFIKISEL